MLCRIANLITEVPEAGDLFSRCKEYICNEEESADITIRTELFRPELWEALSYCDYIYMESGMHFYARLMKHDGFMLHSSAVEYNKRAYLFSGDCGVGKSTHTRLWQTVFGESARIFNDDKPALRLINDSWIAYGTPWCGKDGININLSAPLAGICFMKQADYNRIRRLEPKEAIQNIVSQTLRNFRTVRDTDLMLSLVDKLVTSIPIFELENRPEPEAALLSYETMRRTAEEMGL